MIAKLAKSEYRRALQNPAVAHCQKNFERVLRSVLTETGSKAVSHLEASRAYRSAMPLLVGDENIRDFIACVTFGSNSGALPEDTAAKLFYAAQVAYNVGSRRNKKSSNTLNSGTKSSGSRPLAQKSTPLAPLPTPTQNKGLTDSDS
jgi:hypothetical protein